MKPRKSSKVHCTGLTPKAPIKSFLSRIFPLRSDKGLRAQLIRGGLGSAGIQAANRVLSMAMGVVLARTLGAEGYGIYAYAFAIMSLLMVAAEAGVPTLLMREVAACLAREDWGLLRGGLRRATQFVTLTAGSVSFLGLLFLWVIAERLSPALLATTALMLLVLPVAAQCKTIAHALRGLHRIVLSQALDGLLRPLLVLLVVGFCFVLWPELRQPQYAMAAQLIAAIVGLVTILFFLRRLMPAEARTAPSAYRSKEWLRSALPFTLIGGAGIINNHTDILMLGWFASSEDVGIYRVASQGALLVGFVLQAATATVVPHFAKYHASTDMVGLEKLYKKSRNIVTVISLPVALLFVVFGGDIIVLVFGMEYQGGGGVIAVLAIGYLLNLAFGPVGALLQMTGRESVTARILWVSACSNIILNFLLIPICGGIGAAIATSITLVFYHGGLRYYIYKFFDF